MKVKKGSRISPGNSLPPTGFPYFLWTDEKHFRTLRDALGDDLHSLPIGRQSVPQNTISICQQEHDHVWFWKSSKMFTGVRRAGAVSAERESFGEVERNFRLQGQFIDSQKHCNSILSISHAISSTKHWAFEEGAAERLMGPLHHIPVGAFLSPTPPRLLISSLR